MKIRLADKVWGCVFPNSFFDIPRVMGPFTVIYIGKCDDGVKVLERVNGFDDIFWLPRNQTFTTRKAALQAAIEYLKKHIGTLKDETKRLEQVVEQWEDNLS